MASRKKTTQPKAKPTARPATKARPSSSVRATAAPVTPADSQVAEELLRTHAAVTAAIAAGHAQVQDAMKLAEDAVAQAVQGVSEAIRLARQSARSRKEQ